MTPSTRLTSAPFASLALLVAGCGGGDQQPTQPGPQLTTIAVTPSSAELNALGATHDYDATARDQNGNLMSGVSFTWSITPDSVGTVDSEGTVMAEANGSATVEAEAEGVTGSASLTVDQKVVVVKVNPDSAVSATTDTSISFSAEAEDSNGHSVSSAAISWSTSNEQVARVNSEGTATVTGEGAAVISASSGSKADSAHLIVEVGVASVRVEPDSAERLVGGTAELQARPKNIHGEFVSATVEWRVRDASIAEVQATGSRTAEVSAKNEGKTTIVAEAEDETGSAAFNVVTPVPADLAEIAVGDRHACGIVESGRLLCWGSNANGQLGMGNESPRLQGCSGGKTPCSQVALIVPVGDSVVDVAAGESHTCAVTGKGDVLCWGLGSAGQLGDGRGDSSDTPVEVEASQTFTTVAVGDFHSCGLTDGGSVYCWGSISSVRDYGNAPKKVEGGVEFSSITSGQSHLCGTTDTGSLFCWGDGRFGKLGTGFESDEKQPAPVEGDRSWTSISAGNNHTCAVTEAGDTFCWGKADFGQLGTDQNLDSCDFDGTAVDCSKEPIRTTGSFSASAVSCGACHSCAVTAQGELRCWGRDTCGARNTYVVDSETPTTISTPTSFEHFGLQRVTCGVGTESKAYCAGKESAGELGNWTDSSTSRFERVLRWPR